MKRRLFVVQAIVGIIAIIVGVTMYIRTAVVSVREEQEYIALAEEFVVLSPPRRDTDYAASPTSREFLQGAEGTLVEPLEEIEHPLIIVDFESLLELNSDTVGWIMIKDTPVNYPILQTSDNYYYLGHSFSKSRSNSGSVFADYTVDIDNSPNIILYGHNMGSGEITKFSSLRGYVEMSYVEANPEVIIATPESGASAWRVFAAIHVDSTDVDEVERFYRKEFEDLDDFEEFLSDVNAREFYDSGVRPEFDNRLLALSTCVSGRKTMRLVVYAYQG